MITIVLYVGKYLFDLFARIYFINCDDRKNRENEGEDESYDDGVNDRKRRYRRKIAEFAACVYFVESQ